MKLFSLLLFFSISAIFCHCSDATSRCSKREKKVKIAGWTKTNCNTSVFFSHYWAHVTAVARPYKETEVNENTNSCTHTFNMDTWPCDRKSLENAQTEKWAHNRTSAWRRWFLAERVYVRVRARNSTVILLRPSLQSGRLGVALRTFTSSHHFHFKLIFLLQKEGCIICDTCGLPLSNSLLLLQVSEPAS